MNQSYKINLATAITVIVILFLCLVYLTYHSIDLSVKVDKARLEKEAVLSEQLELNKIIKSLRKEIDSLNEKNNVLK